MTRASNKRLTLFSEEEQFALYGLPALSAREARNEQVDSPWQPTAPDDFPQENYEARDKGVESFVGATFEARSGIQRERTQDVQGRRRHTCDQFLTPEGDLDVPSGFVKNGNTLYFNPEQRVHFLTMTESEREHVDAQDGLCAQLSLALQIGYFKAKHLLFNFHWSDIPHDDIEFLLKSYFPKKVWKNPTPVKKHIYYHQRDLVMQLFHYQPWSTKQSKRLSEKLTELLRLNASQAFILTETVSWLHKERIVRPAYTKLQDLFSQVFHVERQRLQGLIEENLTPELILQLQQLLATDTTLSELSALREDIKSFRFRMMQSEQRKLALLRPLYEIAQQLLPKLDISQQNICYYASLAHFYAVTRLREMEPWQTNLYLLCYVFVRYQQLTDNVAEAFLTKTKELDDKLKLQVAQEREKEQKQHDRMGSHLAKLLSLFTDETIEPNLSYSDLLSQAYAILPKEKIEELIAYFANQSQSSLALRWQFFDKEAATCVKNLRPLFLTMTLESADQQTPWLGALHLLKTHFSKKEKLPLQDESLIALIPKKLRPYLLEKDNKGNECLASARYEYWLYRQMRKRLLSGELCLNESTRHRSLEQELISKALQTQLMPTLPLKRLHAPITETLDNLCIELNRLWRTFNRKLKKGQFPHLAYDKKTTTLNIRKIRGMISDQPQHQIYYKLPACDITDLLTFVEEKCAFLKAFTPLQSYSAKKIPENGDIFACLLAQALNHGMGKMADISDISYDKLRETLQQYLRADTLKAANDKLIHAIEALPIFAYYDIDLVTRYASLDGQKYTQVRPTAKARYSKKYFGTGRGVVAYTLLCNHVPLQTDIIGAHEHESYYALDILQSNTSTIIPQAVTGDMHSVNKANFALLDWFDFLFSPRFTNLKAELKRVYCGDNMENYRKYLIQPAGQINRKLIEENWPELQRIMVTLNQKEITQASIVKKLCTYTYANPIRKALFEYDKLIRSIYTLKYLMDPNLQRQVQRSQNRIESYHQLRGAISEVNGKKELAGNTDVEVEISNECGRLIANAIIYYNSAILSKLLEKYQADGNQKDLAQLERISPIAWQHIHLLGHYVFNQTMHGIDLDQLIAKLQL